MAGLNVRIVFKDSRINNVRLLHHLNHSEHKMYLAVYFSITIDDELRPVNKERRKRIRTFDTGNGDTIVDKLDDGGYQYIIKDINLALTVVCSQSNKDFSSCRCALNGNYDMRCFGLNNALMLIFAFAGSLNQTLPCPCITGQTKRLWLCIHC